MSEKTIVFFKRDLTATGGLEKHTWLLAKAFFHKGYLPHILTEKTKDLSSLDFPITIDQHLSPSFSFRSQKIKSFDRFCCHYQKKHPSKIAFGLDRTSSQTHLRAGNGVHAAFLEHISYHQPFFRSALYKIHPFHRTILSIEKQAFEDPKLKKLFTNSHMVKKEILRFYDTDPSKIEVIHNGVEWLGMKKGFDLWPEEKSLFLQSNPILCNRFHFLFVGHGFRRKGLEALLYALSRLKNKDFFLSIVGKDKRQPYFESLTKQLGLEEHVRFWGYRQDVLKFYQCADALVIPSFYDPFANVTVEALAMGLNVISSSTNGGAEVLSSQNGIVVDSIRDLDAFAHALAKIMEKPKTLSQSITIRNSIKELDFSHQLSTLIDKTLEDT